MGLIIALVYRKAFRGVLYSPSFATTLIMLCMITTPVVMAIKSNVALSMGMVGALSIVRFRTAVKDPLDTAYMFWSLTMGILLGAELYTIALVVVAGISVAMLLLSFFRLRSPNTFLLVTHYDAAAEDEVMAFIKRIKVQQGLGLGLIGRVGGVEGGQDGTVHHAALPDDAGQVAGVDALDADDIVFL